MTDAETTFWSALVQIIPVIMLAMVVEARFVRVNRKKLRRKAKRLRAKYPGGGFLQQLQFASAYAWASAWDRAYTATTLMLLTSVFLATAEVGGLLFLLADKAPPADIASYALAIVVMGIVAVVLSPIFGQFVQAWNDSDAPMKELAAKPQKEDRL